MSDKFDNISEDTEDLDRICEDIWVLPGVAISGITYLSTSFNRNYDKFVDTKSLDNINLTYTEKILYSFKKHSTDY